MDFLKKGLEAAKKAGNKAVNQIKEVRTLTASRLRRACACGARARIPPLSISNHAFQRPGRVAFGVSPSGH